MIVFASYVIVAVAICGAGLYLVYRLELYFAASSVLLGFLLLVYGPAYLAYMLFRRPISAVDLRISNSANFDDIAVSLNLSMALMYVCVIAGIELVDRLASRSAQPLQQAISGWNSQRLTGQRATPWPLAVTAIAALAAAFIGIYNLRISALPTAMLSGGLILPPLFVLLILEGQRLLTRPCARLKQS